MKITAVEFTDFAARRLDDHPGGRHPLERFVGDDGTVGPAAGYIADMGGGTSVLRILPGKVEW